MGSHTRWFSDEFGMRIIAGTLRGRSLNQFQGSPTRPTSGRVREALFGMLEARIVLEGAKVLDLFAGTGALAFEAISRGASEAVLVELDRKVAAIAQQNAGRLGVEDRCIILQTDAVKYLMRPCHSPADLVLIDPPYVLEGFEQLPNLALSHVRSEGWVVIEHDARVDFAGHGAHRVTRNYGRTRVSLFERGD